SPGKAETVNAFSSKMVVGIADAAAPVSVEVVLTPAVIGKSTGEVSSTVVVTEVVALAGGEEEDMTRAAAEIDGGADEVGCGHKSQGGGWSDDGERDMMTLAGL
ncbi:hypothetical protein HK405_010054, partial [Cladochytrium tenue]